MDIPDVLEPSSLTLTEVGAEQRFPRRRFFQALYWEILIGTILAIHVSLNPILLENLSLAGGFSILSVLSIIIPPIVPLVRAVGIARTLEGRAQGLPSVQRHSFQNPCRPSWPWAPS
jgi:hypothetical protein